MEIEAPGLAPIIIDAGTGIRHLGKRMARGAFGDGRGAAHLLISHTHWDHIQGLPYFSPLYVEGNRFEVYARQPDDTHLRSVFASQNEGPYFPVPLESLAATVEFHELAEGQRFFIDRAEVRCTRLNHPWIAMAYRVEIDGASVVYASDTAPFRDILHEHEFIAKPPELGAPIGLREQRLLHAMRERLVELCRGADLIVYDTQFTVEEYRAKPHWGHSTPDDAIAIARAAGARALCMFHHAPARSDVEQDAIVAQYQHALRDDALELLCAYEGLEVEVGGR